MNLENKKILVTGSCGLIGTELVKLLKEKKAEILEVDITRDWTNDLDGTYEKEPMNVMDIKLMNEIFKYFKPNYVFHLFGIKGNPKRTKEKPINFMYPMLMGDTNIIKLAQKYGAERFLYTSSIAVKNPESDYYPSYAKQTAEKLIDAMRIQYPNGTKYCIVRPSNVYGIEDLNKKNLMVVSSLIKLALKDKKLILDIKGANQERDLIHARDIARGMIKCMNEMPENPVNLCSGKGIKIKEIAEIISKELEIPIEYKDLNMILGPDKKIMKNPYIEPEISLNEGIKEVINYARK